MSHQVKGRMQIPRIKQISNIRVSVIIPTLGTRIHFLEEAIKSVDTQTFTPTEIIIVNNGEVPFLNLGAKFSSKIPVKIVDAAYRVGAPQARNIGAAISKSKILAFLDDDDFWSPSFLKGCLEMLIATEADCCLGRLDKFEGGKTSTFMDASEYISLDAFLIMNPGATGSNIVILKEAFNRIGGFDPAICPTEDRGLLVDLLLHNFKVSVSNTSQSVMRMHDQERLTVSSTLNIGFRRFHEKYRHLMNWRDRIYSNWLFRKEEFKHQRGGGSALKLLVLSVVIVLIHRRPRQIWPGLVAQKNKRKT